MKKLMILFSLLMIARFISYAQIRINNRTNERVADSSKLLNPSLKSFQTNQPQNTVPGVKTLYYSIDPTAFSSSWGVYEISKLSEQGVYINSTSTLNTAAPYLVAPVNLPHNATITSMTVIFYDISATQDLQAILWRGGTAFNYNLGQIESNYSGGYIAQVLNINAIVDNQNFTYSVTVSPAKNTQWPGNGNLKIKRITIAYTVPQAE